MLVPTPSVETLGYFRVVPSGTKEFEALGALASSSAHYRRMNLRKIDGLFFEVHPDPDRAPSDGPNMLRLNDFAAVLRRVLAIRQTAESFS